MTNFELYIEDLCREHPLIKHGDKGKCHFSALVSESETRHASTMHYPCVVVDIGDFSFGGQPGNELVTTDYSVMFLQRVKDTGNEKEVTAAFSTMRETLIDFVRKFSRDKRRLRFKFLSRFQLAGTEAQRIYLKDGGLYGYMLFFTCVESFTDKDCNEVFNDKRLTNMETYNSLLEAAEQIRTNELPNSNTSNLIGGFLKDLIEVAQSNNSSMLEAMTGNLLKRADYDELNTLTSVDGFGLYVVTYDNQPAGFLYCFTNAFTTDVTQKLTTNYRLTEDGKIDWSTIDQHANILVRFFKKSTGKFTEWQYYQESFTEVMSESAYQQLSDQEAIDKKKFYFLHEDEE